MVRAQQLNSLACKPCETSDFNETAKKRLARLAVTLSLLMSPMREVSEGDQTIQSR